MTYDMRMPITRRRMLEGTAAAMAFRLLAAGENQGSHDMFGLIGRIITVPGKRDEFIGILLTGINNMPGCLSYVVAKDSTDDNALWVTEVWDTKEHHDASLSLPSVKEAIAKGKPMIAGFDRQFVTTPVGGHGLKAADSH
jgi:quinol monooxygenase YgiN